MSGAPLEEEGREGEDTGSSQIRGPGLSLLSQHGASWNAPDAGCQTSRAQPHVAARRLAILSTRREHPGGEGAIAPFWFPTEIWHRGRRRHSLPKDHQEVISQTLPLAGDPLGP